MVAWSPRMCSSAETPTPGGCTPWLGCASCWGSPSSTGSCAAPATSSTSASDSWPAASTNSVPALPGPGRAAVGRPEPQQQGGRRVPAADPVPHHPAADLAEPVPVRPRVEGTPGDQGSRQRAVIAAADLQVDQPACLIDRPDLPD